MDLPPHLRAAIDRALEGTRSAALADVAERQSSTYRHNADHGIDRLLVRSDLDALAYAAWRMPATFGAMSAALEALEAGLPDFSPSTHLDLGSGPGTALHAANAVFGAVDHAVAIEGSESFRGLARTLLSEMGEMDESDESGEADEMAATQGADTKAHARTAWLAADLAQIESLEALIEAGPQAGFDLVTLGYVQGELPARARHALLDAAWSRTKGAFVIVEPGTTAGYQRLMAARERLVEAGAFIVAPCPHAEPCPLVEGDWCHFAVRVARSRAHRLVKGADLGYEDEKFAYLAVSREEPVPAQARLLRPTRADKIGIELDVCRADGSSARLALRKRDKAPHKLAKKLRAGDAVPADVLAAATPR